MLFLFVNINLLITICNCLVCRNSIDVVQHTFSSPSSQAQQFSSIPVRCAEDKGKENACFRLEIKYKENDTVGKRRTN